MGYCPDVLGEAAAAREEPKLDTVTQSWAHRKPNLTGAVTPASKLAPLLGNLGTTKSVHPKFLCDFQAPKATDLSQAEAAV